MPTLVRALITGLLGLMAACSTGNKAAEQFLQDVSRLAKPLRAGEAVSVESINPAAWDKLYLFPPYTPQASLEESLGAPAPPDVLRARIDERDDVNLLVFMNGDELQLVVAVPRSLVDLSVSLARPVSREQAVIRRGKSDERLTWEQRD